MRNETRYSDYTTILKLENHTFAIDVLGRIRFKK